MLEKAPTASPQLPLSRNPYPPKPRLRLDPRRWTHCLVVCIPSVGWVLLASPAGCPTSAASLAVRLLSTCRFSSRRATTSFLLVGDNNDKLILFHIDQYTIGQRFQLFRCASDFSNETLVCSIPWSHENRTTPQSLDIVDTRLR